MREYSLIYVGNLESPTTPEVLPVMNFTITAFIIKTRSTRGTYETGGKDPTTPCCEKGTPADILPTHSKHQPFFLAPTPKLTQRAGAAWYLQNTWVLLKGDPTRSRVFLIALPGQSSTQTVTPHSAFPLPLLFTLRELAQRGTYKF